MENAEEHLRLNPDDVRAVYMAANGLAALGERERSRQWADRALAMRPNDAMLLYNLGWEDRGVYLVAIPEQLASTQSIGKLVFNKYGITPVLKGVRLNGRTEGIEVPSSKTERELARLANTSLLSTANTKLVVDEVQSR